MSAVLAAIGWSLLPKRVGCLFFVVILGMGSILSWSWYSGICSKGERYDAGARSITLLNVALRLF